MNSPEDEESPFVSKDGTQIVFSQSQDIRLYDISEQRMLTLSSGMLGVNTDAGEHWPAVSSDGKLMAFFTARKNPGAGLYDRDIIITDMAVQMPLQQPGLNSDFDDTFPSFTGNGELVLFQSRRPGGEGGTDIYMYRMSETNQPMPRVKEAQHESIPLAKTGEGLFTAQVSVGGQSLNLAVDTAFSGILVFRDSMGEAEISETGSQFSMLLGKGRIECSAARADITVGPHQGSMRIMIGSRQDAEAMTGFSLADAAGIFGLDSYQDIGGIQQGQGRQGPEGHDTPEPIMRGLRPSVNLLEINPDPEGMAGMTLGNMPLVGGVSKHRMYATQIRGHLDDKGPGIVYTDMEIPFIAMSFAAGSDEPVAEFGTRESYDGHGEMSFLVPGLLVKDRIIMDKSVAESLGFDASAGWGTVNRVSVSMVMFGSDSI